MNSKRFANIRNGYDRLDRYLNTLVETLRAPIRVGALKYLRNLKIGWNNILTLLERNLEMQQDNNVKMTDVTFQYTSIKLQHFQTLNTTAWMLRNHKSTETEKEKTWEYTERWEMVFESFIDIVTVIANWIPRQFPTFLIASNYIDVIKSNSLMRLSGLTDSSLTDAHTTINCQFLFVLMDSN